LCMTFIDGILEDIREKENKPLDTLTIWRLTESSYIWRTSELCISNMIIHDSIVYKEFKPNMIIRVFIPFAIVLYCILFIHVIQQNGFGTAIKGLIFLSVITFALAELLYLTGVSKSRNFKIL